MEHNPVPKHIGIIMDGNRRLAKRLMMKPWKGHEWGAQKVEKLFDWARECNVQELTLYAFSIQNFNRPKEEFDYLMKIFINVMEKLKNDPRMKEYRIRVNFIGRIWKFPPAVKDRMQELMDMTRNHSGFIVNLAMAYGGREEVIDAAARIAEQVKDGKLSVEDINEEVFEKNLYMADRPDLIIRTGGVTRTSNFLAFQSAYSEYLFLDKMWPEFEKEDFVNAIEDYKKRHRRFGR